jgi:hypothetical protein
MIYIWNVWKGEVKGNDLDLRRPAAQPQLAYHIIYKN